MYFSRSIKRFVLYAYCQNKKKAPAEPMLSVGSVGFGPTKDEPTDLQSAPFDHSGNSPTKAATGTRTLDPEITNHVLYQLSYSGLCDREYITPLKKCQVVKHLFY